MTISHSDIVENSAAASRWYSSLFIKCLAGILIVFLVGSFLVFFLLALWQGEQLKREMSPVKLEDRLRTWISGLGADELARAGESPYCRAVLQSSVSEILGPDSALDRRYNHSQVFHKMSLVLEYRREDTACRFSSGDPDLLWPLMEMDGEKGQEVEIDDIPDYWVSLARVSPEERPEAVVTLGLLLDNSFVGLMFPELKAIGHVTLHLLLISFLSALLLAVYVLRRIRRVERAAAQWAEGQLKARINDRHRDEIGRLAATFDHMADALDKNIEVKQSLAAAEERNRMARDLHDTAKQRCFALGLKLSLLARDSLSQEKRSEPAAIGPEPDQTAPERSGRHYSPLFLADHRPSRISPGS